jgi:hypothetical protein
LLTAQRQSAVIPLGLDHRTASTPAALRYVGVPPASRLGRGSDFVGPNYGSQPGWASLSITERREPT